MKSVAYAAIDSWRTLPSKNSNRAGAALPSIPRRHSSSRHVHTLGESSKTQAKVAPMAKVQVLPPTPTATSPSVPLHSSSSADHNDDDYSDSRNAEVAVNKTWSRGRSPPRANLVTEAESSLDHDLPGSSISLSAKPTNSTVGEMPVRRSASVDPLPRTGLNTGAVKSRPSPPAQLTTSVSMISPRMLRKKSGEPVKSSLKSGRRPATGNLATLTITPSMASRSAPATPSAKAVHFDAQLEHVKLFLAEQRPTAVSRDGSPTDDTDGTESDFPSFIFGRSAKTRLQMNVNDISSTPQEHLDVSLLSLELADDGTSIIGRVRVRNIAFEKWVGVRFTFDSWQTTSEVTAKHLTSVNGGAFDIFGFTIRLNDMLSRIETRTLLLAIRFHSAGREMWDNNGGRNYPATFSKAACPTLKPIEAIAPVSAVRSQSVAFPKKQKSNQDSGSGSGNGSTSSTGPSNGARALTALTSRLEVVAQSRGSSGSLPSLQAGLPSADNNLVNERSPTGLGSLSGRYDFDASLRNNPWSPRIAAGFDATPQQHFRAKPTLRVIPTRPTPLGSPRDKDSSESVMIRNAYECRYSKQRNSPSTPAVTKFAPTGYFETQPNATANIPIVAAQVKASPPRSPEILRCHSFPPKASSSSPRFQATQYPPAWSLDLPQGSSEDSTPSISSPSSSSRSSSPEPDIGILSSPLFTPEDITVARGFPPTSPVDSSSIPRANYSSLLNR